MPNWDSTCLPTQKDRKYHPSNTRELHTELTDCENTHSNKGVWTAVRISLSQAPALFLLADMQMRQKIRGAVCYQRTAITSAVMSNHTSCSGSDNCSLWKYTIKDSSHPPQAVGLLVQKRCQPPLRHSPGPRPGFVRKKRLNAEDLRNNNAPVFHLRLSR